MKTIVKNLGLILIALVIHSGCNNAEKKGENKVEVVKIGSILPLTGPASVYGEYTMSGQKKALVQLQSAMKNKRIEIYFEDGKGDPKASISSYQKLRRDGVNIFITTLTPICLAILPLAKADNVLLFADAAHPVITADNSRMIFRHSNTSSQEALLINKYVIEKGYKRVAIVFVNDDYGKDCAQLLKSSLGSSNISTTLFETFDKTATDFNVVSTKIRVDESEAIVIIGAGQNMGMLVKRIRELEISAPIIANIGYMITGADKLVGSNIKGISYVNFDFKSNENSDSTVNSIETLEFGTVMLLGEAIKEKGGEPDKISNYILGMQKFHSGVEEMVITGNDIKPGLKIEDEK